VALRKERLPETRVRIFEDHGWLCHLCKQPIDPKLRTPHPSAATLDHVVPLARGGRDWIANIRPAHLRCNRRKGRGPLARGDRYYPV